MTAAPGARDAVPPTLVDMTATLVLDRSPEQAIDVLRAAAAGDQQAWEQLVAHHGGMVWAIARGFRLGDADAGDAVQTTWLRLVENLDRIVDPTRLPGWLATTVRRECLHVLRRRTRERLVAPAPDSSDEPADHTPSALTGLLTAERDSLLWQAFATIPAASQQLLRMLTADPRPSYAEIGAALAMPIGSIGPSRRRALDHLRRAAAAHGLHLA